MREYLQRYQQSIIGFGFVYRPYIHISLLLLMYVSVLIFAYFFKMNYYFLFLTVLIITALFPIMLYLVYEYSSEENHFAEFTNFITHICGTFKQHPKILNALIEVQNTTKGNLASLLQLVIDNLRNGESYEDAMKPLLVEYDFYLFRNLVQLMISVETYGAKRYEEGINLIQDDLDDVIEDMYLYQHQIMQIRGKVFLLCLLSIAVCFICRDMMLSLYDFNDSLVYQITLFIYINTLFMSITSSQLFLRHTWCIWSRHE